MEQPYLAYTLVPEPSVSVLIDRRQEGGNAMTPLDPTEGDVRVERSLLACEADRSDSLLDPILQSCKLLRRRLGPEPHHTRRSTSVRRKGAEAPERHVEGTDTLDRRPQRGNDRAELDVGNLAEEFQGKVRGGRAHPADSGITNAEIGLQDADRVSERLGQRDGNEQTHGLERRGNEEAANGTDLCLR